jgi:hypothetical protein
MSTSFVQRPVTDRSIDLKVPLLCMLRRVHPGFVGPEAYTIFGSLFKKNNNKKNEYKIRCEREYLFRCKSRVQKLKLHQLHGKSTPTHCFTIISQLPFLHYRLNIFTAMILYTQFHPGLSLLCDQPRKFQFYCLNA